MTAIDFYTDFSPITAINPVSCVIKRIYSACRASQESQLVGYARKALVSLQDTPYYHCVARCVRRAWLWGVDEYAGRDYSHRKQWVIERLAHLSQIFAVEICA